MYNVSRRDTRVKHYRPESLDNSNNNNLPINTYKNHPSKIRGISTQNNNYTYAELSTPKVNTPQPSNINYISNNINSHKPSKSLSRNNYNTTNTGATYTNNDTSKIGRQIETNGTRFANLGRYVRNQSPLNSNNNTNILNPLINPLGNSGQFNNDSNTKMTNSGNVTGNNHILHTGVGKSERTNSKFYSYTQNDNYMAGYIGTSGHKTTSSGVTINGQSILAPKQLQQHNGISSQGSSTANAAKRNYSVLLSGVNGPIGQIYDSSPVGTRNISVSDRYNKGNILFPTSY